MPIGRPIFRRSISAEGTPRAFFGGNSFYTTSADRMARGLLPHAVTAEDVMAGIGGTVPPGRRCATHLCAAPGGRRDPPTGSPRSFRGGAGRWPPCPAPWRW
ncbi:MAG: hypothetical protein ACLUIX_00920 [Oscillospiraceae bacterium]